MAGNYEAILQQYLKEAWGRGFEFLLKAVPAERGQDEELCFRAFGTECRAGADRILLDGKPETGPKGVLIAIYLARVPLGLLTLTPLTAFKEIPDSGPYQAAFAANAERLLVPAVERIFQNQQAILDAFSGHVNHDAPSGDFSFTLYPLPKIPLYYIFHRADEEFPAAVTCLFGARAHQFMPLDALADVAEYTGRTLLSLL